MAPVVAILISEWNDFSNSELLSHYDASHQVLARFGRRCHLKNGGHLGYRNQRILAILNLYVTPMPSTKFQLNLTYDLEGDVGLKNFKMASMAPSWILEWNGMILAILNLCVTVMPPIKFQLNGMVWEEMSFEEYQDGHHCGHLGYRSGMILTILNHHVATRPPTKFQLNPTCGFGGDVKNVKS